MVPLTPTCVNSIVPVHSDVSAEGWVLLPMPFIAALSRTHHSHNHEHQGLGWLLSILSRTTHFYLPSSWSLGSAATSGTSQYRDRSLLWRYHSAPYRVGAGIWRTFRFTYHLVSPCPLSRVVNSRAGRVKEQKSNYNHHSIVVAMPVSRMGDARAGQIIDHLVTSFPFFLLFSSFNAFLSFFQYYMMKVREAGIP